MRGLVIKSLGSSYVVVTEQGATLDCHVKGNFRIRGIRTTNPVAVGDWVQMESQGDGINWITEIEPRRNYIIRRSTNLSKQAHILAANVDQVLLMITVNHPVTALTFVDRFLATAEAYRVPVTLLINKTDLYSADELQTADEWQRLYTQLDYPVLQVSAKNPDHINQVRALLAGKVTLLSGNSGVGKSTLLNALFGEEKTRTGLISSSHDKGMHTTTFSEMYALPDSPTHRFPDSSSYISDSPTHRFPDSPSYISDSPTHRFPDSPSYISDSPTRRFPDTPSYISDSPTHRFPDSPTYIIDTPGVKGFGSVEMDKYEVSHYFRDLFQIGRECRYDDCLHINEPGCAVIRAVEQGQIALSRYESYISLLGDSEESKYR